MTVLPPAHGGVLPDRASFYSHHDTLPPFLPMLLSVWGLEDERLMMLNLLSSLEVPHHPMLFLNLCTLCSCFLVGFQYFLRF